MTKKQPKPIVVLAMGLVLIASGCSPQPTLTLTHTPFLTPTATSLPPAAPTQTRLPPSVTLAPTLPASPTRNLSETGWRDFQVVDFEAVHSRVNEDANQHLIFGNLPISPPAKDLSPELARLLGRWEGVDLSPPVAKDNKGVLVVQEITNQGGKAFLWSGSVLQHPFWVKQIDFRVVPGARPGAAPAIEWQGDLSGGPNGASGTGFFRLTYDQGKDQLRGGIGRPGAELTSQPLVFSRSQTFYVYKDYAGYFASLRIIPKAYRSPELQTYGAGYLIYLPQGYEKQPQQKWPLIFFLCGTGERGADTFLLAKNGPWNWIIQKGGLPFIIAAPMLNVSTAFRSFPEPYLDKALDEVLADYRVDQKRVYLTGLSMGGEATYRFALYRPQAFAAIAPFSAFNAQYLPSARQEGFKPFTLPMQRLQDIPVWAFHGADDPIIPLAAAQSTVDSLIHTGGKVKFTILPGHDHDSWSEAYLDPAFYAWLLQYKKP